jgi:outer membrane protein
VPLRILVALAAVLTFSSSPLVAQEILTLEEALRTALVQNPNVASATAAAAAATSSRWADWGAFLPTARLNANLSSTDFTNVTFVTPEGSAGFIDPPLKDTRQSSNLGVSLGLGILNPDRITNVKAGAAREDAADMRLTAAERVVIRDVKQAYFEALKQQQLVAVAERQLESRLQDLDLTERRYRIAAASRSDLLGAEIDASDAELRLLDARDAQRRALRGLQVLLAVDVNEAHPDDTELIDVDLVPDADGLDPRRLTEAAKASNPNLQALRYDEKAAAASKWSAKAQYLPTIDIGLSFGRNKELAEDENLFDFSPANTSATFNIVGSWNLLSGFTRKRQTAQADQQLRQTRAELLAQELLIEKDVRDLVNELTRRSRRLELLERNVRLASERLELARQQYRLGSIPYFNLQQAIDRLQQAEQQLFQERYDYLIGWASLEEKVGGDLGGR